MLASCSVMAQHTKKLYKNGNLQSEGILKDGVEDGEWKYYYQDGTLNATFFYPGDSGR